METEIERYNHVMYASKSHINQFFTENISEAENITISKAESTGGTFEVGLNSLFKLNTEFSDEIGTEEVHQLNFDESFLQVKKVINLLSDSDMVYPVSSLTEENPSPSGLYHFDCPLQLLPTTGPFDDEKFVDVIGKEDDVEFEGTTSWDNWGSRSHRKTAIEKIDPYPFKGVLKPLQITEKGIETVKYDVQYLYILEPDQDKIKQWREYQDLIKKHPGRDDNSQKVE